MSAGNRRSLCSTRTKGMFLIWRRMKNVIFFLLIFHHQMNVGINEKKGKIIKKSYREIELNERLGKKCFIYWHTLCVPLLSFSLLSHLFFHSQFIWFDVLLHKRLEDNNHNAITIIRNISVDVTIWGFLLSQVLFVKVHYYPFCWNVPNHFWKEDVIWNDWEWSLNSYQNWTTKTNRQ